jgi:hypothetical protein
MVNRGRSMEIRMYYVKKIAALLNINLSIAYEIYNRLCIGGADFSEMPQEQFERIVRAQYAITFRPYVEG